jgi:hypothetical protein
MIKIDLRAFIVSFLLKEMEIVDLNQSGCRNGSDPWRVGTGNSNWANSLLAVGIATKIAFLNQFAGGSLPARALHRNNGRGL